ncbi:DUF975 family protein [Clostridium pasteurianum]|uniref:Putative integral membrane protein n=1 Tax=Clostridium pasteurianum BC1 TaxID=86416 RepID=R4K7A3_CLOPA|nr:DUF975 family protein [Clostridium pasteurianum]AGK99047.1 putative integral membrane protein [Clostridium pasteurianum BC1]
MYISEIKSKAKESLRGRKGKAALATFLYYLIVISIPEIINFIIRSTIGNTPADIIAPIVSIVWSSIFLIGFYKYFISYSDRDKDTKINLLFSEFHSFYKALGFQLLVSIAIAILYLILGLIGFIIVQFNDFNALSIIILIILILIGIIGTIYISLRVVFSVIIIAEDKSIGVIESIKISLKLTKGYVWKLFLTGLSFIGWIILVGITFGIVGLYVIPYMQLTYINFYFELKNKNLESNV